MPRPPLLWLTWIFDAVPFRLVANQHAPISRIGIVTAVVGIAGAGDAIDMSSMGSCVAVSPSIMDVGVAVPAS